MTESCDEQSPNRSALHWSLKAAELELAQIAKEMRYLRDIRREKRLQVSRLKGLIEKDRAGEQ